MVWTLVANSGIFLVMVVFSISYILLQRKILSFFKVIAGEREDLASRRKGMSTLSIINIISFSLIAVYLGLALAFSVINFISGSKVW